MKVWLLTDGEPFFFEEGSSCHRTGSLAKKLTEQGHKVIWWTSRVHHTSKTYRNTYRNRHFTEDGIQVNFLDSSGYKKNMSIARILHARSISKEFIIRGEQEEKPDIIVAAMPSPEFCHAGSIYAAKNHIPFLMDVRDPWPDIFSGYFPPFLEIFLRPLIYYYQRIIKNIAKSAAGIMAVSQSQLDWGISYSQRQFDGNRDKLIYIGYENKDELNFDLEVPLFSETNPLRCMYITSWGSSYDSKVLVETARILQDEVGQLVQITATGDGEGREASIKNAKGLENIHFTGFVSSHEINKAMQQSHVGLVLMKGGITKYWIGNKIGEYIASSFGIVNNVQTEVADVINKYDIGMNVSSENPRAVADAIIHYLKAPSKLRDHMVNSNSLYKQSFDRIENSKIYIEHLEKIYRQF
tara:strand:+ start:2688 stop:3920 length:1233 start_codon:yes stop_codon:yes gene_type:complete